jgi:hypothetical protein
VKSSLTTSAIATILQLSVNSLRVARLRYLANAPLATPAVMSDPSAEPDTSTQIIQSLQHPRKDPDKLAGEKSLQARVLNTLGTFLPVRKLTDEEYLATLEKRRFQIGARLKEIEREEIRIFELTENGEL